MSMHNPTGVVYCYGQTEDCTLHLYLFIVALVHRRFDLFIRVDVMTTLSGL